MIRPGPVPARRRPTPSMPPLTRSHEPRTLRTLNRVLAGWLGSDPGTADDLNAALSLLEMEDDAAGPPWETRRLVEAARHLLRLHSPVRRIGHTELGVVDFRGEPFEPLFARIRVMDALASIGPQAEPLLWVTGLREAFVPNSRKRSPRAVAEYLAAQALIEDIVVKSGSHGRPVKLVFL